MRIRFVVIFGLFVALIVGAHSLSHWSPLSASTSTGERVKSLSDPPAWAQDAEAVMTELETWRGKTFVKPLDIQIKPRERDEPAGWYSPETHQLIVTTDGSENFKRGVMLHEIFHALQDQTFDLLALHQAVTSQDEDQALDALIEGEAMLAVSELLNYNFADHARLPKEGEISDALFNRLFEYGDGMTFVRSLRDQGDWAAVDQAFQSPPKSTREIYHPALYPTSLPSQSESHTQYKAGEYGFRLWLARDAETRKRLDQLSDSYLDDTLQMTETGEHTWDIQLKNGEVAALVRSLAPKAIAKMPDAPESYELLQDQNRLRITWLTSLPS